MTSRHAAYGIWAMYIHVVMLQGGDTVDTGCTCGAMTNLLRGCETTALSALILSTTLMSCFCVMVMPLYTIVYKRVPRCNTHTLILEFGVATIKTLSGGQ